VLTEDGAVLESGGELKNDERSANIITSLINLTDSIDPNHFNKNDCQKISIVYEEHSYIICLSNKKVYVVKRLNHYQQRNNANILVNNSAASSSIGHQPPQQLQQQPVQEQQLPSAHTSAELV